MDIEELMEKAKEALKDSNKMKMLAVVPTYSLTKEVEKGVRLTVSGRDFTSVKGGFELACKEL